jgi:type III pantothenate kinase
VLLTVSIGNTHTLFGLWLGEQLRLTARLPSDRERTPQDWETGFRSALGGASGEIPPVEAVALASVVPALTPRVVEALTHLTGVTEVTIIDSQTPLGMTVAYERPETLGSDRFLNAFAVYERYLRSQSVYSHGIVVDCGTATTFSVVSRSGRFLGGSILPGIGISLQALLARTAQLPPFEIVDAPLLATNTLDALRAGVLYGFSAQIEGLCCAYKATLGEETNALVVGTGGALSLVETRLPSVNVAEPFLPLHGLRLARLRRSE